MVPADVLKKLYIFEDLDNDELVKLAEICNERTLKEGEICFSQNRRANDLHICRSGKVIIKVKLYEPWARDVILYRATDGEVFGWSALVPPYTYTSSAICAEKTEEICIKGSDLMKLLDANPHIGYIIMRNISAIIGSRLNETRIKLCKELAAATHKDYEW